ncbi:MAG: 30S ribosomal protein S17 [Nanoarchaeota archaeon]|nr:30S ribosomal protein S17 [Nanoarchaeota archaeon]
MAGKKTTEDIEKQKTCDDRKCPHHGSLKLRGREFIGTVLSSKAAKTVAVQWVRRVFVRKFERYEKRRTKIMAYNPLCIDAKEGDSVLIKETRPLSKTKKFCVVEVINKK